MAISLNQYETELLSKIMIAGSQEEVKILIDNSLKKLGQTNGGSDKVNGFVDTAITYLETLDPMIKDASEWSNINMARIHFQHIKRESELITY